jgi:hypothetical protein
MINQPVLECSYRVVFSLIDKGLLEVLGPSGSGSVAFYSGKAVMLFQTGRVYDYALFMLFIMYVYLIIASM